eukprot:9475748-Pyramimonas_sp.AAC.1
MQGALRGSWPGGDQVDGSPPAPVRQPGPELFGIDELEEFRRGVQLVCQPGPGGQLSHGASDGAILRALAALFRSKD